MADQETTADAAPDVGVAPETIQIYACPACGNWFGAGESGVALESQLNLRSSMRNLAEEPPENWRSVVGTRARCGHCGTERVPLTYIRGDCVVGAIQRGLEQIQKDEDRKARVHSNALRTAAE